MVNSSNIMVIEKVKENLKVIFEDDIEKKESCQDVVLNCPELIRILFEHLIMPVDKLNFRLTCRKFYESIKNKVHYEEESILTDKFHTSFTMLIKGIAFKFLRGSLKMYLIRPPNWDEINFNIISQKIQNNLGNVKKLFIEFDSFIKVEIFSQFNCFKSIKILEFGGDIQSHHLLLFNYSISLQPHTIIFSNFVNFLSINDTTFDKEWSFPKSMKYLSFKCDNQNCLHVLEEGLKYFSWNEIDTLDIVISFLFPSNLTSIDSFYNVIKYFKKVNIVYSGKHENSDFIEFSKSIINNDFSSKYSMFLKFSVYTDLSFHDMSYVGKCLKYLIVESAVYIPSSKRILVEDEVNKIYYNLFMMRNLETLIIDFWIINSGISFEKFILSINKNLKNLQVINCQQLKLIDLRHISSNLRNLEILSLHEVESDEITLVEIFELFPAIKCLEVFFSKSFNSCKLIEVMTNKEDDKLKWPKTTILNIFTLYCEDNELNKLRKIVSNTPLKSGQANLAIQSYRKFSGTSLLRLIRMTFQRCSGCSDYFKVFKVRYFPYRYRIFMYEET
uniref:F-box domain-containing protein n=2 Tax=Strongyloides papillosus TaxID=174720 RepID=A0A0N5CAI8_STREA